MSAITVARISIAPVKGMRLVHPERVLLARDGIAEDRAFYLVDPGGVMHNAKRIGALERVRAEYDGATLALTLPGGEVVRGPVELGEDLETRFFSLRLPARVVDGPFAAAISQVAGRPLRLVTAGDRRPGVDRGVLGAASLISRASLQRLARQAGVERVDARRFRMTFELDGAEAHEEDRWIGGRVAVGGATVLVRGNVGRCLVTTRNPETGAVDFKTLHHIERYRGALPTTEPLPFGVHAEVLEPGEVAVGDPVSPA